jgi:Flp pilus assembly pilin Flp
MQQLQNAIGRIALMVGGLSAKLEREEGQALVEYALIIALVAVACTVALTTLSTSISNEFDNIVKSL